MRNKFRRLLTFVMVAAMIFSLMVPALATESGEYSDTPVTYSSSGYDFGKISHSDKGVKEADGIVDYTGNGTVGVSGVEEGAEGQGDRGQSYAWSALAYGDYVYVGTCYAAMGNTLTAMDTIMGHDFDEDTMRAELNAIFNGTFFYGQEDGGNSKGILVKVNVKTGEVKVIMANSVNGIAPLFRNAIEYDGKLYFCGSVNKNNTAGLPSVYEINPTDDTFKCVYQGLSNYSEYIQAYKAGVCTGIRGMAVYEGKLVISNVGVDGAYLLISDNPSEGFTKIATQSNLCNYPAIRYVDSVYGGGIWEIVEYNGSLYVAMCTGTPETRVGDNMQSFAIIRGDCSGDWNDPEAWTWTPVVGDTSDGAKYTFGIDPERTRAAACNMCIYDGYLYVGEYNDEEIPLEELMFDQDFGFLARNLEQSVNLYRMSINSDGSEQFELVVGEATELFPNGGILCKESGFGDYENQYFWQSKVFDGKLWLGTFDTSSLLEPLGQFTNGDLLKMSRSEWLSQINYIKVLFKLLMNNDDEETTSLLPSSLTKAKAASLVDEAVSEADSDGDVSITSEQRSSLISGLLDGSFYSVFRLSTINKIAKLNTLLAQLTDLVETNDISGFVEIYQQANDLYSDLSSKLPDGLKKVYDVLVKVTELENMKDLIICLNKLSTAERGFGLYTISSENGELSLETITTNGFGDPYNHGLRTFAVNEDQGWMVIGTANPFMGTQLWRTVIETEEEEETDPEPSDSNPFTDIAECIDDYQKSIMWAYTNGITSGITDTLFAPYQTCTRAQAVTFLWRAMGCPAAENNDNPFTDVKEGSFYYDAVMWAVKKGITSGTSETTFSPNAIVNRAQAVTFLYRANGSPEVSGSAAFKDVSNDAYYNNAVIWAVNSGITLGTSKTTFSPNLVCTRAQIVTFLYRDIEK